MKFCQNSLVNILIILSNYTLTVQMMTCPSLICVGRRSSDQHPLQVKGKKKQDMTHQPTMSSEYLLKRDGRAIEIKRL